MSCECGSLIGKRRQYAIDFQLHLTCLLCSVVLPTPRFQLNSGPRALVAVGGGIGWDLHCQGHHQLVEQGSSQTVKAHTILSVSAEI